MMYGFCILLHVFAPNLCFPYTCLCWHNPQPLVICDMCYYKLMVDKIQLTVVKHISMKFSCHALKSNAVQC
jgi:hypothetical protein